MPQALAYKRMHAHLVKVFLFEDYCQQEVLQLLIKLFYKGMYSFYLCLSKKYLPMPIFQEPQTNDKSAPALHYRLLIQYLHIQQELPCGRFPLLRCYSLKKNYIYPYHFSKIIFFFRYKLATALITSDFSSLNLDCTATVSYVASSSP